MSTQAEEFVSNPIDAAKEIHTLQQGNIDKIKALAQFGKALDPAAVANMKIDTFIETFLDESAKLVYLKNLETRLRQVLDEALKSARIEQLTQGIKR
jgi:hypothetical protein